MAVQAQYPSNVHVFNRISGQEQSNIDYSLHPQSGGFLDQSHLIFNNGGNNLNTTRKRGRDNTTTAGDAAILTTTAPIMNPLPFPMQSSQPSPAPQPHQLMIDLSQLHNNRHPPPNNNVAANFNAVSTGLGLSFGGDHETHYHHHLQHHYQQQQQNQNSVFSLLSEDVGPHIKRQRDELDSFLQAQGEQLRQALAEKRERHYRTLLSAAEESVIRRLRQKDAEFEKATRRNGELEARAAQLTVEAQVWQAKARAIESAAASLQAQLQQAISNGGCGGAATAQDQSAGGGFEGQVEDAESAYVDPDRVTVSGPSCKTCRKRVASVVVLPCRHLCLCTDCDQVVQACPLCLCVKNSSVEVSFLKKPMHRPKPNVSGPSMVF